jgi:glycosyltransferase involved in cell wall biosynthesis
MVTHMLIVLAVVSLLELLLWLPPLWRHVRKPIACVVMVPLAIVSGLLIGSTWSIWAGLLFIVSIYRLINLLRIVEGRSPLSYMAATTRRTSLLLIGSQGIILLMALDVHYSVFLKANWLEGLRVADFLAALLLVWGTLTHIRKTRAVPITETFVERDLPTLTVAIPARNETDDLEACLQSLVANSYPKLEILVLDDCSQNKHTPSIIKDFAHAGVRFLAGKQPPEHWLAKNYAYQQLADEANGEILLFCGVDTRFQPDSLEVMVETMLSRKKSMLSIVPNNALPRSGNPEAIIIQPLRYAWELVFPRRRFKRPPVLSTCWLLRRELLKSSGGFKAITNSTSVESYFARAAASADGYSFLRSVNIFGLSSRKPIADQRATAVRTRYPQTHRRPEIVALVSLLEALVLVIPFVSLIAAAFMQQWASFGLSIVTVLLLVIFYVSIVKITYGRFLIRSLWLVPFAATYDIGLLNYSMWRYEFREVIWKDRNVCIPLMQHYGDEQPESSALPDLGSAQKR